MDEIAKSNIKRIIIQAIPLIFLFWGMFGAFKIFEAHNKSGLEEQNKEYLIECTSKLQQQLDKNIQNYSDTIKSISYLFSELASKNMEGGPKALAEIEKKTQFDDLFFVEKNTGKIYSSGGEVLDLSGHDIDARQSEYFEDAMKGHYGIGVLYPSLITGKRLIGFYAPVVFDEEILGVLVGCIEEATVKKDISTYFYGILADSVLISENLKIIGVSSRFSIYDYIDEDDDPYDFRSVAKIKISDKVNEDLVFNALRVHQEVPFTFESPYGGTSFGYVKKLENLDWMILLTFPADAIKKLEDSSNHAGKILEAILIGLFTLYILHLINMNLRHRRLYKKKLSEETLKALIDDLTGVYNRRAFEEDVEKYKNFGIPQNLTLIEFDINGLKAANDTLGHKAGDELITATAQCLKTNFSNIGKIYRMGGDEFAVFADAERTEINVAVSNFRVNTKTWRGRINDELAVSMGIAQFSTYKDKTMDEIKTIADMLMYEDKDRYYKETGKNRRAF